MNAKELFDGFNPSEYEEAARQRWGQTKEYQESARRTKGYTKQDWAAIKADAEAIGGAIAALMDREPTDPEVQAWVGKFHKHINDRFYTCSLAVFRGLGAMYVADERFLGHYEKVRPGLAQFMQAAMNAYCDRQEGI